MRTVKVYPGLAKGTVQVPPSKSLAHRAVICAALADGESRLTGLHAENLSDDIRVTIAAMQKLGADIRFDGDELVVRGGRLALSGDEVWEIDCGESGSTLRFLIPIVSLLGLPVLLTGHGRLPQRPQTVYQQIFAEQDLCFMPTPAQNGWLVRGPLHAGDFHLRGDVSSQFISGLLFALPLLEGDSRLHIEPPFESRSYVQLTLAMLRKFGVHAEWLDDYTLQIPGAQSYQPCQAAVEGDFSQLAFFAVLATISAQPEGLQIMGVDPNSAQGDRRIIEIIREMGGDVEELPDGYLIRPASLQAAQIDLADCPDLGPVLAVLAAQAEGESRLYNAGRLRIKESDRIADVETELKRCGVVMHSTADEMFITGLAAGEKLPGGVCCQAHNDHRIVMALAVLAAASRQPLEIVGAEAVNKSYPNFFADLQQNLGIKAEVVDELA